ncbi:hypothetical protein EHP00_2159 [Ecytonucleospora hepatopenaei]|uniref:Uncharacterized protein n=1 Tax=Ecytonucleospora hepatopenaei TaxID=646526 RepID=A0A1W0E561_9MICR|nr:hypothetical protein EHP00_2159 [Ecytonucleospora hepatopenaei]
MTNNYIPNYLSDNDYILNKIIFAKRSTYTPLCNIDYNKILNNLGYTANTTNTTNTTNTLLIIERQIKRREELINELENILYNDI